MVNDMQTLWTITIVLVAIIFYVIIMQFPRKAQKRLINPLLRLYIEEPPKPKVRINYIENLGNNRTMFYLANGERRIYYAHEYRVIEDLSGQIRERKIMPLNSSEVAVLKQKIPNSVMDGRRRVYEYILERDQSHLFQAKPSEDAVTHAIFQAEKTQQELDRQIQRNVNYVERLLRPTVQQGSSGGNIEIVQKK